MARFVIVYDTNPYDDDSATVDCAVVEAKDFDSPITVVDPIGGDYSSENFLLIQSMVNDHSGYTPSNAVDLFGLAGMYREEK